MMYPYYRQLSTEELQMQIEKARAEAGRKGQDYEPILASGRSREICQTWWGQSWCRNLERYADYSNRIARGKHYVRSGAVIDLKIRKGIIEAKVQGSRRRPYDVQIQVSPLPSDQLEQIIRSMSSKIESLESLVDGKFPEGLKDLLLKRDGLFPDPRQIHFDCSCPDWAHMCKHVAAVLYGVGVRLDENPLYFFELRGIDPQEFIYKTAENKVESMLANAGKPSRRIMEISEEDLSELFSLN